jgi:hypothetical protein
MTCHVPRSMLDARTRTSTSPSSTAGLSTSAKRRTSSGAEPYRSCTIAFIGAAARVVGGAGGRSGDAVLMRSPGVGEAWRRRAMRCGRAAGLVRPASRAGRSHTKPTRVAGAPRDGAITGRFAG